MTKSFRYALDNNLIEPSILPDGTPFVVQGVQYYNPKEGIHNMQMGRFLSFGDTLRRHDELKLNDEILTTYLDMEELLLRRIRAQATLDVEQVLDAVQELMVMNARIKERRTFGLDVAQVFEVASIYYFSENEETTSISSDTNRKKILDWTYGDRAPELYAFFLMGPIGSYVPYTPLSDVNILKSIQETNELEYIDLMRTLLTLKTDGSSSGMMSIIKSRVETLNACDSFLSAALKPTTTTVQPGSEPNSAK